MSKQFKVGDRVEIRVPGYGVDRGEITHISKDTSLGYLVELDEPCDSGDGVLSYDQWVEGKYLEVIR